MLCIPAALIYTYGLFANNSKQATFLDGVCHLCSSGWGSAVGEYQGNPLVNSILGTAQFRGKEVHLAGQGSVWAVVTTGTMCGAVNGMHDSLMPTGGFSTLFNLFFADYLGCKELERLTYLFT